MTRVPSKEHSGLRRALQAGSKERFGLRRALQACLVVWLASLVGCTTASPPGAPMASPVGPVFLVHGIWPDNADWWMDDVSRRATPSNSSSRSPAASTRCSERDYTGCVATRSTG